LMMMMMMMMMMIMMSAARGEAVQVHCNPSHRIKIQLILMPCCSTTRHEGAWGERIYSSYSFPTSALDGVEWSSSRPGRASAQEIGPPVPIVQEAGWAPEPVWTQRIEEKSFGLCRDSCLE
jgi:hypothetical protein